MNAKDEYGVLDEILNVSKSGAPKLYKHKIDLPKGENYALIVPFGDIHYGHQACDKETLKLVLKWMYDNKNVYVIGMGDLLESSIIDSPGLFDQDQFLDDQISNMIKLLKPLADEGRILGLHAGNHELRLRKKNNLDITNLMCQMLGVTYLGPAGAIHEIKVNTKGSRHKEVYTIYSTHGSSGAMYPHTKMQACMRLALICDTELYCMGHVHSLFHQKIEYYKPEGNKVISKAKHYVLTGSYLNYWETYAHEKGYPPSGGTGSCKIKLHSDCHRISVSL